MAECDECVLLSPYRELLVCRTLDTGHCRAVILRPEDVDRALTLFSSSADEFLEGGFVEGWDAEALGVVELAPRVLPCDDVVGFLAHR